MTWLSYLWAGLWLCLGVAAVGILWLAIFLACAVDWFLAAVEWAVDEGVL